jgi:hypothetical protein
VLVGVEVSAADADAHRPLQVISACISFTRRLPGEPAGPRGQRRCHRWSASEPDIADPINPEAAPLQPRGPSSPLTYMEAVST